MAGHRISIRGAREHNLKDLSLDLPRDQLVVITGLSGSGKSSLAFDTIYAEGQRRYVESLSAYARQFMEQMNKPDVDSIDGLSPAISIEQKSISENPRSTVGTVTEIYDYLRLLFARVGQPHCTNCDKPIAAQTVQQIVDQVLALPAGSRIGVLAPIVRGRKGEYRKELLKLRKDGFVRVRIDGEVLDLEDDISLDKRKKHDIDVFINRIVVKPDVKGRLTDSIETALRHAEGVVKVSAVERDEDLLFSTHFACVDCGLSYPELAPRMFSFNNPHGACPTCSGLGHTRHFNPDLVVPDHSVALKDGAVKPWAGRYASWYTDMLIAVAKHLGGAGETPWKDLSETVKKGVLYGTEDAIQFRFERDDSQASYQYKKPFEGVIPNLKRRMKETQSETMQEEFYEYLTQRRCDTCGGRRLRPEALHVYLGKRPISAYTALSVRDAERAFAELKLSAREAAIAERVLKEIRDRLGFLVSVGLDYLTLDRAAGSLSGGEGQRIRLATQIGSSLMGVLYILDEPSIGLHQRDNDRLLMTLRRLRDLGNTVLVVEHDEDTILAADHVVDMGPGAGALGGHVVAQGTPDDIMRSKASLTGQYLSGAKVIPVPRHRRSRTRGALSVRGASHNNLRGIDVDFPLGCFVAVTGVSGSGKSSLVIDTLYKALAQRLHGAGERPAAHKAIEGLQNIDKVIDIDQSPIGRTPRSNPATYTGMFGDIRDLFASLPESKARGYKPGRYSFNVKGGRCEACEGDGIIRIEMHFLPDVFVMCEQCQGQRYNRETLEVEYKGKNVAQVLDLTTAQALEFLKNVPAIRRKLETVVEVGLGYVKLGQAATTLSGGEAQRIKLSRELSKRATGRTLYILDEPTTGLHFEDIRRLLGVLDQLVETGNTVVVIEHNLDVIKSADWVIDLGPEGGDGGGTIVAAGTPEQVARDDRSYTGHYLRRVLNRGSGRRATHEAATA